MKDQPVLILLTSLVMPVLQEVDPLEAIELELDEQEDAAVYDWFYDDHPLKFTKFVNGPSYKRWKLPLPIMSSLYRQASAVCMLCSMLARCWQDTLLCKGLLHSALHAALSGRLSASLNWRAVHALRSPRGSALCLEAAECLV